MDLHQRTPGIKWSFQFSDKYVEADKGEWRPERTTFTESTLLIVPFKYKRIKKQDKYIVLPETKCERTRKALHEDGLGKIP